MDEYINLKKDMRAQASDSTLAGLTEQVMSLERELRNYDEEIAAFQSSNSVVLLQEQGNSVGATLSELRRQLAPLKSEHELLKVLTPEQNLDMSRDKIGGARNPEDAVISDPEILRASQQIMQLKAQQQDLGQHLRPAHPKMIALTEDIERREKMLDYYRQQVTDQSRKEYSRSLDVSKKQMEIKLSTLATQMENLQNEIQQWDDKVLNINRQVAEYQKIKAKQQRTQNLYDKLLSTMQTLDVNKGVTPENVTVMEKACKAFAERQEAGKSLAIAAGIGIFLGIVILFLLDRLDDRMNTITEYKDSFDENVLAQVPREKAKGRKQEIELLRNEDDRHAFAEAFRSLRSSLLYMHNPEQKPRLMLVTSSVPNDGKSVVSSNLAITLANAGSRVLLVDADLRKGVLHERFQIQEKPGLSEVLDQGVKWEDCVRPTEIKRLSLLARGAVTHNSSELFISEVTKVFLKAAVAQYDYVLVDTAPVMAADDVTSIAPLLDGIIFVIRAEQTSARVARASLDLLMQRQARILGVVFNAVKATSSDYYYYYKYRDYYHQPAKPAKSSRPAKPETPVKT